jgi:transcriptional regulator with XRE-family HTH domain
MPDLRTRLAKKIKRARHAAGMTQEQLAEAAATSVEFVSRTERGLHTPRPEKLIALANALRLDTSALFERVHMSPKRSKAHLELEARAEHLVRGLEEPALATLVPLLVFLQERSALKREE